MPFNATLLWRRIEAVPARSFVIGAAAAIAIIGVLDHFTGPIVSLAIFYLVPVGAAAWVAGRNAGYALSLLAAIVWAVADRIGPLAEPKVAIAYLNDASMLVVFLFLSLIISALRNEIERQRELMQDVQRRLLPASLPSVPGVDVASRWIPAWTVAGDYYDLMPAGDNRVAICLADVSGKGMPAALIMSNVQATVRAFAAGGLGPDRMLSTLNQILYQRLRRGLFVTIFYAVIDVESGTFTYASAGHNPAILRRHNGTIERLPSTGPIAGVFENAAYKAVTVDARLADALFVYSDGITEYRNARGEEFGERRLVELFAQSPFRSADQTCQAVVDALRTFGESRPYNDDVTMLAIVRKSAMSEEPA